MIIEERGNKKQLNIKERGISKSGGKERVGG
jgi:hypothetical protein